MLLVFDYGIKCAAVLGIIEVVAWQINVRFFFVAHTGKKRFLIGLWTCAVGFAGYASLSQPGSWGRIWAFFWIAVFLVRVASRARSRRALRIEPKGFVAKRVRAGHSGEAEPKVHWNQAGDLEEVRIDLKHPDFPPNTPALEFTYLSDIHVGSYAPPSYWDKVMSTMTDMGGPFVFGGDLVSHRNDLKMAKKVLGQLDPRKCSWAILGNHDHWTHAGAVGQVLGEAGFTVLRDEFQPWPQRKEIGLYGSNDFSGIPTSLPKPAFPFTVLFCHTPDRFFEAVAAGYSIVVCGHTHGGQIKVPIFGELIIPSVYDRLFTSGLFCKDQTMMWIGKGAGGPPFFRRGARPEVIHFRISGSP